MSEFIIPCETVVRLASILTDFPDAASDWCNSIRIDNGQAVATNRIVMSVENIGGPAGVVHLIPDAALIAQCRVETPFSSKLHIIVTSELRHAVAKTTLGYVHPGNCAIWSDAPNELDDWRSIVTKCAKPADKYASGMFWDAANVARLAASSPTGRLVFEHIIDASGARPTVIRDVNDPEWFGLFYPSSKLDKYAPATLPTWVQ